MRKILEVKRGELRELKSQVEKSDVVTERSEGKEQEKCMHNVQSVFMSLEMSLNLPKCGQL